MVSIRVNSHMLAWNNLKTVDVDREGGSPASDQTGWKHQTLEPRPALPLCKTPHTSRMSQSLGKQL